MVCKFNIPTIAQEWKFPFTSPPCDANPDSFPPGNKAGGTIF